MIDRGLAFEGWKPMPKHRSHSIAFKRQVAQEFIGGETLHRDAARRFDVKREFVGMSAGFLDPAPRPKRGRPLDLPSPQRRGRETASAPPVDFGIRESSNPNRTAFKAASSTA